MNCAYKAIMPPQGQGLQRTPSYRLGVNQTIASREGGGASSSQAKSSLVALLVLKWSWGELPATFIQEVAWAAVQDGCKHPEVIRLSKAGASGTHRGNINRDVEKLLGESLWASSLSDFKTLRFAISFRDSFAIFLRNLRRKLRF